MNKKNWLYLIILLFGIFWIVDLGDNLEETIRLIGGCLMIIWSTYKNYDVFKKINEKSKNLV